MIVAHVFTFCIISGCEVRIDICCDEYGFGENRRRFNYAFARVSRVRGQTIVFGDEVHFETTHRDDLGARPARPGFSLEEIHASDKIARNNAFVQIRSKQVRVSNIAHRETEPSIYRYELRKNRAA